MKICPTCHEGALDRTETCPGCGGDLRSAARLPGTALGGMRIKDAYELQDFIDEGGMSWVYRGTQSSGRHPVAVKLFKRINGGPDPAALERFTREAQVSALLDHPHILMVLEAALTPGGLPYIVSEYVNGVTLAELMMELGALPLARALNIYNQILAAVEAAHGAQVVHRDIKPENVMVTRLASGREFVKVLDFGLALHESQRNQRLTIEGYIMGTPAYMSPEQIRGEQVTASADIYALGVLLFELLSGLLPFKGKTVPDTLAKQLYDPAPVLSQVAPQNGIPRLLDDVVATALAKRPQERYASVDELRQALVAALSPAQRRALYCVGCHEAGNRPLGHCPMASARPHLGLDQSEELAVAVIADGVSSRDDDQEHTLVGDGGAGSAFSLDFVAPPEVRQATAATVAVATGEVGPPRLSERVRAPGGDLPLRRVERAGLARLIDRGERVVVVSGPAGAGKTRLLRWLAGELTRRQAEVVQIQPDADGVSRPWRPMRLAVARALALPRGGPLQLGVLRQHAIDAGLSPEDLPALADLFGLQREALPDDPATRFRERVCVVLRALHSPPRKGGARYLLVDDVERLDIPSRRVIQSLTKSETGEQTHLVLCGEAPKVATGVPHARIPLGAVTDEDVERMAEVWLPGALSDEDVAQTRREVRESLLHLDQLLRQRAHGDKPPEDALLALLRQRLDALPGEALDLLQHLAAGDSPPVTGDATLALLQGRGMVDGDGAVHLLVARSALMMMDPVSRRDLHRERLQRLQRQGGDPFALARHAFEAKAGAEALERQLAAAEAAEQAMDPEGSALVYYRRAAHLARWELRLPAEDRRVLEIALRLGTALRRAGHLLAAETALQEVIEPLSEQSRAPAAAGALDEEACQRMMGRALLALGQLNRDRRRHEEAAEKLMAALERAQLAGDLALAMEVVVETSDVLERRKLGEEACRVLEQAATDLDPGPSPDPELVEPWWQLWMRWATLCQRQKRSEEALERAERALALAEDQGNASLRAASHLLLGQILLVLRRKGAAERHLSAGSVLFANVGDRRRAAHCLLLLAELRDPADGVTVARALSLAQQIQWARGVRWAMRLSSSSQS